MNTMRIFTKPTDSDAALIAAHKAAKFAFNADPTADNERAWAKAQNALYDYQSSMALGHTVTRLDLRADGTVKKFGE